MECVTSGDICHALALELDHDSTSFACINSYPPLETVQQM
jgi:hypothetical protein